MTIAEAAKTGKTWVEGVPTGAWMLAIVLLASSASFGLGILTGRDMGQGRGITVGTIPLEAGLPAAAAAAVPGPAKAAVAPSEVPASAPATIPAGGQYVASKSGTKYYLPWCGTVARIKDENKVWFETKAEAEAAGYEPAANCKGL